MKKTGMKRNIPMYAAGVLFCLTLVSLYWVSGLYARFITIGSTVDAARTAAFYLKAEGSLMQYIQCDIIPGTPLVETLEIQNESEVTMEYTLTIRRETSNLPMALTLTEAADTNGLITREGDTFTVKATLPPSSRSVPNPLSVDSYSLTMAWPADTENAEDPNLAYMGVLDYLTVTVDAEQVD